MLSWDRANLEIENPIMRLDDLPVVIRTIYIGYIPTNGSRVSLMSLALSLPRAILLPWGHLLMLHWITSMHTVVWRVLPRSSRWYVYLYKHLSPRDYASLISIGSIHRLWIRSCIFIACKGTSCHSYTTVASPDMLNSA